MKKPVLILCALVSCLLPVQLEARTLRLVMLGDSITAGLGLPLPDTLPVRIEALLKARGHDVVVENAGVSGDTSAGGLARLDWSAGEGTDGVILALGGNDALRALAPDDTQAALDAILARLKARNIPVLLSGMMAPRNLGADYATRFDAVFPALSARYDVVFHPFLLEGVAGNPALNQKDGIHPNADGVKVMADKLLPAFEKLIERARLRP